MAKPIVNPKKWTKNDFRLLVVLLLTVIYPVFVSSFFALYVFILLPLLVHRNSTIEQASLAGWYHYYWLFAALFWVLLCVLILPCFWDRKKKPHRTVSLENCESPSYSTKPCPVQPFIQVEEGNEKQRFSILTDKSQNSSESIEKGVCEEKAEKESLEKSRESLQKSCASLGERDKLTQSGEFLNDFIDSLESEELKKKEAECEVHAEESKDNFKDRTIQDEDNERKVESIPQDHKDKDKVTQENLEKKRVDASIEDLPEAAVDEPDIEEQKVEKQQEAIPLQIGEENVTKRKSLEGQKEVEELSEDVAPLRQKARPTIDTSRASGCYECSMPTPKSADIKRPESNMVFLFVNPETLSSEEGILVEHTEEVYTEKEDRSK